MSQQQLIDLLYAIGMESPTGWARMPELCALLQVPYPPERTAEQLFTEGEKS
jgi:hypothetical protein